MKYITPQGLEKIKKELEERKTIKRKEIAERLEEAKTHGDLSENAEYAAAKEDQGFNEGRILELEAVIKESVVVDLSKKIGNDREEIQIGSTVEAQMESGLNAGKRRVFTIIGSQEVQPDEGKISDESPLGKAFLGHKKGDIIEVKTPGGKVRYKIISIK